MSRLQPYRVKIPIHIIQLMDIASRITLFLVGNNGPLSFVFRDRLQNKYKTTIGSQIKCSCSPHKNDHCIHSIYILLKIFKVQVNNPIFWQSAYLDNQLQDLLDGKHTAKLNHIKKKIVQQEYNFYNYLPSDLIYQKQVQNKRQNKEKHIQKLTIVEDSVCPICQEEMTNQMCLTHCKLKCGNNYHLQCLKIWINHKQNEGVKVTCPMCRVQFQSSILIQLNEEQVEYNRKKNELKGKKYQCSGCKLSNIPNLVHKCLFCTQYQLCKSCYDLKKHLKHPFIVQKQDGRWKGAQQRRPNQIKIKQFIDNRRQKQQNKRLIQKLRKIQQDPNKIIDFVASAYPYVSKYISENIDPYKKLDINQDNIKCMKCGSKRMIFLRRLPCGHFIDHECLKQNILHKRFYCQQDGNQILKGYQNLIKQQNQVKNLTKQQILQQFNPKKLQIHSKRNSMSLPIEQEIYNPTLNEIFQNAIINRFSQKVQNNTYQKRFQGRPIYKLESRLIKKQINQFQRKSNRQQIIPQILNDYQQQIKHQKKQSQTTQIRIRSIKNVSKYKSSTVQKYTKTKQRFGIQQLIKFRFEN